MVGKVKDDLFLAILSMDAYNRGYDPGIAELGGVGARLGNADIISDSSVLKENGVRQDSPVSFYAVEYNLSADFGDETIISFRGTKA